VIRVGVIGACGRMGLMVCRALAESKDFALVAAIDRSKIGQQIGQMIGHPEIDAPVSDELERLLEANAEVAIDFTHPDVVMDDIRWCISHAVHTVVGTTGISPENLQEIEKLLSDEEYRLLQLALLFRPEQGSVIPGTGGLRKLRWKQRGGGKRGGLRVVYYWQKDEMAIYMLLIYRKSQQEDLTSDQIKLLKRLVREELA